MKISWGYNMHIMKIEWGFMIYYMNGCLRGIWDLGSKVRSRIQDQWSQSQQLVRRLGTQLCVWRFMVKCFCFVHLELQLFRMQSGLLFVRLSLPTEIVVNSYELPCCVLHLYISHPARRLPVLRGRPRLSVRSSRWWNSTPVGFSCFSNFQHKCNIIRTFIDFSENPGRNRTKSTSITLRNLRVWRDLIWSDFVGALVAQLAWAKAARRSARLLAWPSERPLESKYVIIFWPIKPCLQQTRRITDIHRLSILHFAGHSFCGKSPAPGGPGCTPWAHFLGGESQCSSVLSAAVVINTTLLSENRKYFQTWLCYIL